MNSNKGFIGFACAYTPLPLIHSMGYTPYRILPDVDCPDQAGHLMHDNLCPHVKRILDRAMSGALPDLQGMVFMNSCDSMRRLYDAWRSVLPDMKTVLIDLPVTVSDLNVNFFRNELKRMVGELKNWSGSPVESGALYKSFSLYNDIAGLFNDLRSKVNKSEFKGGSAALQAAYNKASASSPEEAIEYLTGINKYENRDNISPSGIPVYLFGNVMPETEAFTFFESCGAKIIAEDLCTGSRLFTGIEDDNSGDIFLTLARGLLSRKPCARTFDAQKPGNSGHVIASDAREAGAKGIIGYTAKFCDPYIARMPGIREALRKEGIPFLLLEGDCTLRSIGQQRTRIEAFIEMIG